MVNLHGRVDTVIMNLSAVLSASSSFQEKTRKQMNYGLNHIDLMALDHKH